MGWQECSIFIVIFIFIQQVKCHPTQEEKPPIVDYFSKNWIISGTNTLTYSRSFNRHHEFGYVTCNKIDKNCNINVIHADATDYRTKNCSMRYDLISGKTGDIALYLPNDEDVESENVVQAWWLKGEENIDTRLTALNLRSCMNAGFDITPVSGHPSKSRVVQYRYPSFDLVYSDAFKFEKRVQFVSFTTRKSHERAWNLNVDQKYMFEEKGVELADSSRGFFYLSTDGEPDWKVRVMFANSTARVVKKFAVIEHLNEKSRIYPKTSSAYQKYGLCWKNLNRDDARVNCTQFKIDGRRSINEVHLIFHDTIDWLAVHNLEEPAMLVVTGKCDIGKCNGFNIIKIDNSGQKRFLTKIDNLDAECPTAPFDLSMDIVEDLDKNTVCFNFVCLSTRYKESSAEKDNVTLQYRRHCLDRNFITEHKGMI